MPIRRPWRRSSSVAEVECRAAERERDEAIDLLLELRDELFVLSVCNGIIPSAALTIKINGLLAKMGK